MDSKDMPLSLYGWWPSWIWPKKRVKGVEKFEPYDFLVIWSLMMQYPPLTQFGQTNLANSIFVTSQPPLLAEADIKVWSHNRHPISMQAMGCILEKIDHVIMAPHQGIWKKNFGFSAKFEAENALGSASWAQRPLTTGIVRQQFPLLRGTTWRNNGSSTRNGSHFEHDIRILRGEC